MTGSTQARRSEGDNPEDTPLGPLHIPVQSADYIREIASLRSSMHFLRCPSCGAKALASASRCPRCTKPFDLLDGRGERMKLVPCRSCEVLLPENVQQCPWCKTERRKRSFALPLGVGSLVIAAALALVFVRARSQRQAVVPAAVAASEAPVTSPAATSASLPSGVSPATPPAPAESIATADGQNSAPTASVAADSSTSPSVTLPPPPATKPPTPQQIPVTRPAATPSPAAPTVVAQTAPTSAPAAGGEWEPATATTWINVRSAARPDAPVVRIVKPNDVVQLGAKSGGWRLVRGGGFSGWAGARHFAVNSR